MGQTRWLPRIVLLLIVAAMGFRVAVALRPGLWGDEIFSLAMATGHSLEHPPAEADTSKGDFVEPATPQSPSVFRRYAEHEKPPAGPGRVSRAVLLSDTNPPLYYLMLNYWTRAFGTGDADLRLFSVWWAVLVLPFLWALGQRLGRRRAAWTASLLYSFSPVAIYYSAEGRMYSLVWVIAAAFLWLTLALSTARVRIWVLVLWVLAGVAGLLTHYFFTFVWVAAVAWLLLRARPRRRLLLTALVVCTCLVLLPWYREVPESLARWRVTGPWLAGPLPWPWAIGRPFALAGNLLSGKTELGGLRGVNILVGGMFLALAIQLARRGSLRRMFSTRRLLLWAWLGAACLGPLIFDILRHTTTTDVPRYASAALPAALLLAALAMDQLQPKAHLVFLAVILTVWLPGAKDNLAKLHQPVWGQYRNMDARLNRWARPGDVVLVHSIPSGAIGAARYLRSDIRFASWIVPLNVRQVPRDLEVLLAGCRRVAVVRAHLLDSLGDNPGEVWLRAHARLVARESYYRPTAEVVYYEPLQGTTFFPDASPPTCRTETPQ